MDEHTSIDEIAGLSAPARRALAGAGITTLGDLTERTETELAELHGMGPKGVRTLSAALRVAGLSFEE